MTAANRSSAASSAPSGLLPLPELLAPAGTREALDAAIRAGADAVYFGGNRFNARMAADNFDDAALRDAIAACSFYGVRSNITLNTLPTERELPDVLRFAEMLAEWGADAVICADLGTASLLHRYFPDLQLHASTQCAGHNTDAARFFASLGFSRMVAARELSFRDMKTLCAQSPIETELFIHGALCVSQSGGCLFSSLVGGRSGNRGACAQPCRLPYTLTPEHRSTNENAFTPRYGNGRTPKNTYAAGRTPRPSAAAADTADYPLSLKDNCLARHVTSLLSLGAASFKIEGRMKGPAYVEGVVRIWRRLLDERRNADDREMAELAALFSRGGTFTDGYFRGVTGCDMRGIRTEADKEATRRAEKDVLSSRPAPRRIPCDIRCTMRAGEAMTLTLSARGISVSADGPVPEAAGMRPTTEEDIRGSISKLGATPFCAQSIRVFADDGLSVSLSALNALRRDAAAQMEEALKRKAEAPRAEVQSADAETRAPHPDIPAVCAAHPTPFTGDYAYPKQASFLFREQIPNEARSYYDILYLPPDVFLRNPDKASAVGVNGILLPPVIFDSEADDVRAMLQAARQAGITHALVSNPGHIALAAEAGFLLHGDMRLNIWTAHTADVYKDTPLTDLLLSPELNAAQIRSIQSGLPHGAVTYGRLPMMTLQRCIIRERTEASAAAAKNGCTYCDKHPVSCLSDRKNTVFPVTRTYGHRNIVWNAAPVYMADKKDDLSHMHLAFEHHIFTTETVKQVRAVIAAYTDPSFSGTPYEGFGSFRRI
ncbi:MAG: DUF3656 domain-containing protein [Eubacteriales bacterium]